MKTIFQKHDAHTADFQRELYNAHYRRLYNTCLRILGDRLEAEEAMHDAFLKIFTHIGKINSEQAFYPWSQSIAIRTAIDRVRKKKIRFEPADNLAVTEEEPVDEEAISLTVEKVKLRLAELPDGYRIILSMRLLEQCEFADIAEALNIKEVTVRTQYIRGKQRLVQLLKN